MSQTFGIPNAAAEQHWIDPPQSAWLLHVVVQVPLIPSSAAQ
jgi:hypothetical protein